MSNENGINPDQVTTDALVEEMQRINPTVLQLAASNIRAAQWREVAMKAMEKDSALSGTDPAESEPVMQTN